jgi:hypothetical protein
VWVVLVGGGVHPPEGRELAQVEEPLAFRRAEEEVGERELFVEHGRRGGHPQVPRCQPELAALLEHLEVHGVVDVGDDDLVGAAQRVELRHGVALEDDDVGPRLQLGERGILSRGHAVQSERRVDGFEERRGHEGDVILCREQQSHVPGPDRRTRHPRSDRIAGDDENPRHRRSVSNLAR